MLMWLAPSFGAWLSWESLSTRQDGRNVTELKRDPLSLTLVAVVSASVQRDALRNRTSPPPIPTS